MKRSFTTATSTRTVDVILQGEIEALKRFFDVCTFMAYSLRRRLELGAVVENGQWCLHRDQAYRHENSFWGCDLTVTGPATADGAGIEVVEIDPDEHGEEAGFWPLFTGRKDQVARQQAMRRTIEAAHARGGKVCFCQDCVASQLARQTGTAGAGADSQAQTTGDGEIAAVNRREMDGLRMLQQSNHWLNSYIGGLLCDFGTGNIPTPNQVFLALADSIEKLESERASGSHGEANGKSI
jgi:hypothetical protein